MDGALHNMELTDVLLTLAGLVTAGIILKNRAVTQPDWDKLPTLPEYLARHPGQVMSRAQIREAVLGWESDADDAAISMQVSRARRKLSEAGADPIATVWGMGYKWQL